MLSKGYGSPTKVGIGTGPWRFAVDSTIAIGYLAKFSFAIRNSSWAKFFLPKFFPGETPYNGT
jgi:hypothetical protein